MIEFFMAMSPPTTTYQMKQVGIYKVGPKKGKPFLYEPSEVKETRSKLKAYLAQHRPDVPYEDGVRLIVRWCFPRGKHGDGEYKITAPDTDNLQKMLKDVMTDLHYWRDDALVCSELVEKFWAEIPGIYIRIEEVE